jgi:quercetin dioxygenase-like cupin family protein
VELDIGQVVLLGPGEGEVLVDQVKRTIRLLLAHELLVVTLTRSEAGERGAEPHIHKEHVDAFYVLEGEVTFRVGPALQRILAPAGTFVAVPPHVIHGFDNDSAGRCRFLNFHAPNGGFAKYMRGVNPGFDSFDPPADGGRSPRDVTVTLPGTGEQVERPLGRHWIQAEETQLSAILLTFEPGWEGVDPHTHADHVDAFFVLDGDVEFLGGQGGPETFFAAPPGTEHGFRIPDGGERIALLNVHAPDTGFVERLRR